MEKFDNNERTMPSAKEKDTKKMREEVLLQLSSAVNTLNSLNEILIDIVGLTSIGDSDTGDDQGVSSIAEKQDLLLSELGEWKHYLGKGDNARNATMN